MTDGADTIPQKLRIGAFQIVRVVDVRAKKSTKRKKAPGVVVPHRRMLHWEECQPTLARPPLLPDPYTSEIRLAQKQLVEIADRPATSEASVSLQTLEQFIEGLRTSWQEGEVRPTSKLKKKVGKYWRRCPDPLLTVTAQLREWFDAEPWRTSRELLERLPGEQPDTYPDKLLRTLQRRVKVWRRENAHHLVFGTTVPRDSKVGRRIASSRSVPERAGRCLIRMLPALQCFVKRRAVGMRDCGGW